MNELAAELRSRLEDRRARCKPGQAAVLTPTEADQLLRELDRETQLRADAQAWARAQAKRETKKGNLESVVNELRAANERERQSTHKVKIRLARISDLLSRNPCSQCMFDPRGARHVCDRTRGLDVVSAIMDEEESDPRPCNAMCHFLNLACAIQRIEELEIALRLEIWGTDANGGHLRQGGCPDPSQPPARDPECSQCCRLEELGVAVEDDGESSEAAGEDEAVEAES